MKKLLFMLFFLVISVFIFLYFFNLNTPSNNLDVSKVSENTSVTNIVVSKETELSNFTTKIYTKDENRQNNLSITCSILNGYIVKSNEIFSFTSLIGPATSEKGYLEADIYDSDGNITKGFGGGNCQVSSTLYNAVLSTSGLSVIERHEHSKKVPYVPEGKDAAVAYGSVDFKFKNENSYDIKINASTDKENVYITLLKIQ